MPNLIDYKDSKNIIIWLFMALIGFGSYTYQGDQNAIKLQNDAFRQLIKDECGQLASEMKEFKNDVKEMKVQQQVMATDIAVLKIFNKIPSKEKP